MNIGPVDWLPNGAKSGVSESYLQYYSDYIFNCTRARARVYQLAFSEKYLDGGEEHLERAKT